MEMDGSMLAGWLMVGLLLLVFGMAAIIIASLF
jgi:hypothetical protein